MPSAEQAVARPSAKRMAVDANLMLAMDVRRFLCAMQEVTGGSLLVTQRVFHEAWERCAEVSAKPAKRTVAHQAVGAHNAEGTVKRVEFLTRKLTIGWRNWAMSERQKAEEAAWQYEETDPLALSACLPKSIADEKQVDTVACRFLSNISKGGLAHSASDALEFLNDVQAEHPSGWLAVLNPPRAVRTQSAEDRRLASVESAHP